MNACSVLIMYLGVLSYTSSVTTLYMHSGCIVSAEMCIVTPTKCQTSYAIYMQSIQSHYPNLFPLVLLETN